MLQIIRTTTNQDDNNTDTNKRDPRAPWTTIAASSHPNKQHLPFSEGRGISSTKRYRKRITNRRRHHALASQKTSHEHDTTQPNTLQLHTRKLLANIHNTTNNILLRKTGTNDIKRNQAKFDKLIQDFNKLAKKFDEIHQRLTAPSLPDTTNHTKPYHASPNRQIKPTTRNEHTSVTQRNTGPTNLIPLNAQPTSPIATIDALLFEAQPTNLIPLNAQPTSPIATIDALLFEAESTLLEEINAFHEQCRRADHLIQRVDHQNSSNQPPTTTSPTANHEPTKYPCTSLRLDTNQQMNRTNTNPTQAQAHGDAHTQPTKNDDAHTQLISTKYHHRMDTAEIRLLSHHQPHQRSPRPNRPHNTRINTAQHNTTNWTKVVQTYIRMQHRANQTATYNTIHTHTERPPTSLPALQHDDDSRENSHLSILPPHPDRSTAETPPPTHAHNHPLPPILPAHTKPSGAPPAQWDHNHTSTHPHIPTALQNNYQEHWNNLHTEMPAQVDAHEKQDHTNTPLQDESQHHSHDHVDTPNPDEDQYFSYHYETDEKEENQQHQNPRDTTSLITHKKDRNFQHNLTILTQNARGLPTNDDTKIQSIIHQMKQHTWSAACLQETWRLGEDDFHIDGYRLIFQGHTTKNNNKGHTMGGVCIILNPTLAAAHKRAGNKKISFPKNHAHEGRLLGVHLHFEMKDKHGKKIKDAKRRDNNGKKSKALIKIALLSTYHPIDPIEHCDFNGATQNLLSNTTDDTSFIFGGDINCNVGTRSTTDESLNQTIGPYGLHKTNQKGISFLQHLAGLKMRVANSYFQKPNYATWTSPNHNRPSYNMLDVFCVSTSLFKRVTDCGTTNKGIDHTDHSATLINLNLCNIKIKANDQNNEINGGRTDWQHIAHNQDTNNEFNARLSEELTHQADDADYGNFFKAVRESGRATATKEKEKAKAWFEMSKEKVQPTIDNVTALRAATRDPSNPNLPNTKIELARAIRLRNIAVREAKCLYMSHIARQIGTLSGDNTKDMWNAINNCKLGNETNYTRQKEMSLLLPNGTRATNDKDNMTIMQQHCEKLFNNKKMVTPGALNHIATRQIEHSLDAPLTWKEFARAIRGLKNNKSPGENEIPAEAFKAMNAQHKNRVFNFINSFWNNTSDFPEWHSGRGIPIQKTQHPTSPNQYRIVNLMDVGSKIFSRILTTRLYSLLEKHGTKYQFGATPKSGCQDGNFTLKTLLHLRRQHNIETYVVFADLVKAFDTSDHILITDILEKYGAPEKFRNAIKRLYTDLRVTLKIGKESTEISQSVGVRQGDNLSPVIFLFIMTAFSEILDAKWTEAGLPQIEVTHTPHNQLLTGQLTGQTKPSKTLGETTNINKTLYLDDSSFPFNTREDAIIGAKIIKETFADLGLEMHCGNEHNKKSKTEILYIPTASFYTKQSPPATIQHPHPPNATPNTTNETAAAIDYDNPTDNNNNPTSDPPHTLCTSTTTTAATSSNKQKASRAQRGTTFNTLTNNKERHSIGTHQTPTD